MKNLSQISVILMTNLSHFGHLRLAGMGEYRKASLLRRGHSEQPLQMFCLRQAPTGSQP